MNIATAANKGFLKYVYVMLTSFLEHNAGESETCGVYLLSADLTEDQAETVRELVELKGGEFHFIRIDIEQFPKELPSNEWITVETYFRLLLPELLPEDMERILYLDADLVVLKSLNELYETDFEGRSFVACKDGTAVAKEHAAGAELFEELRKREEFSYFNAGVLLFNLEKLRRTCNFDYFMEQALLRKDQLLFHDQDLLNLLFAGDVKYADAETYNLAARTAFNIGYSVSWVREHTAVVHYAGPKPWRHKEVRYALERFWWEYAGKTPFYTELLEEMVMPEIDAGYMDQLFRQLKQENDELKKIVGQCMNLLKSRI